MAGETLRTASGLLANFPDNTAGLIDAVHSRDFVVSSVLGVGFLEDTGVSFDVPIPNLVDYVNMNVLVQPAPVLAANFAWTLDGNNSWIPDYTNFGVTVPAGVERLVGLTTTMIAFKQGGGTGNYSFQYFVNGVPIGNEQLRLLSSVAQVEIVPHEFVYEPALSHAMELRVRGEDSTDDLTVTDFRQRITGVML